MNVPTFAPFERKASACPARALGLRVLARARVWYLRPQMPGPITAPSSSSPALCAMPRLSDGSAQHRGQARACGHQQGRRHRAAAICGVGPAVLPALNLFVLHLGQNTQMLVLKTSAIASLVSCHRMKIGVWGRRVGAIIQPCIKSVTR